MPDYKLSEESARAEWAKFLEHYEIDLDSIKDERNRAVMQGVHDTAVKNIRLGRLEVLDGGKLKQTLKSSGAELVWDEIGARHKIAMDAHADGKNYNKTYGLAGALTGLGQAGIERLTGVDMSLVEVLGAIFLQI